MKDKKEYYKKWYEENKERIKEKRKDYLNKYREDNKEKLAEKSNDTEYKAKRNAYMREYYQRTRDERRAYCNKYRNEIRPERAFYERCRKFGLTTEQFLDMVKKQDGKCALCGRVPPITKKCKDGFNIDHDHSCCSGKTACGKCVRALLCVNCNNGIGCFADDIDRLQAAIKYLPKWKTGGEWQ